VFFSRRGSYLVCGVLLIVSALCFQFCRAISSVELLIIGRLIVGLASGLTFSIVPMYLTEIAPLELRGTLGVLCSMGVTGGVVVGQVFSLQQIFGTEDLWQFALSFYAIMVIVCYMAYPWLPESPKYLYVTAGRQDAAVVELKRLRGKHTNIRAEIEEMNVAANEGTQEKRSLWSVIRDPTLLLPLVIVCALQAGQQLSGINAVSVGNQQRMTFKVKLSISRSSTTLSRSSKKLDFQRPTPNGPTWAPVA
jgi:MFS transporter, SP family, solute carrier family 2 (facilitated glucose transporter), member 3